MAQLSCYLDCGDIVLRPVMSPGDKMRPQRDEGIEWAETHCCLQRLDRLPRPASPDACTTCGAVSRGRIRIQSDREIGLRKTLRMRSRHPQCARQSSMRRSICRIVLDRLPRVLERMWDICFTKIGTEKCDFVEIGQGECGLRPGEARI